jgi:MoaA/NifB/PqqE/SkfB family radical SAM enzyme
VSERFDPAGKLPLHRQFSLHMAGEKIYPIGIEISPSGVCQASCGFCFYANSGELGSHRTVFLDRRKLQDVLAECEDMGVKAVTWTGGGEPTLHPEFRQLVSWADACCLEQGLFTNALAEPKYDPSLLSWIRVTMTDKPYNKEVIRQLRGCKTLGFAFNYSGHQDDDYLHATLILAECVGADYVQVRPALAFHGQTVDIHPPNFHHPLMLVTDYKFEDAKHPHGYATCEGWKFCPFLWEDGNLDVCAYMRKHEGYTLGNVYKDTLKDILDRAPASVPVLNTCQVCCKLHEMNKFIHHVRGLSDVNFP